MNIAEIKKYDITNGDGIRVSIFVTGCEHYCTDCFNKEIWSFDKGTPFTMEQLTTILDYLSDDKVDGLSILGGEPLHPKNFPSILSLVRIVKALYPEKSIWIWTGYRVEELLEERYFNVGLKICREDYEKVDVLIDGRFDKNLRDSRLKYRGSSNQRVINVKKSLKEHKIVEFKA